MATQSTADRPEASRTVIEVALLTVLAFGIALVGGVVFLVPLLVLGYDIQTTLVLAGSTAASQVAMGGLAYAYARYRSIEVPVELPSVRAVAVAAGGVVLALVVAIALSLLLAVLDLVPESVIGDVGAVDPTFFLALAALSVLVVAPIEEFLFRGVIQGRLRQRFGPAAAIAGSSLLFGSLHLANYAGEPITIVAGALLIACVGAIFGTLYELTDNLAVPILVHAIYNVVLLLLSYVAVTAV